MRDFFYCLVLPHSKNNHRPSLLHHKILFLIISFFVLSPFFFSSSINPLGGKLKAYAEISVRELLEFTNQKRIENGLKPLLSDPELSEAASKKADDMFAKNYWAHNSPTGATPWVFIKESGYNYVYAGENLAKGFNSSGDIVNAWMASSTHRANILSENYTDVGFSVKSGQLNGEQTFLVVQEFGSKSVLPLAQKSEPKSQNTEPVRKVLGFELASSFTKPSFSGSETITLIVILSFISVLFIDLILIERKKIARIVGHNLDHAIFLGVIAVIIIIFNTGSIL